MKDARLTSISARISQLGILVFLCGVLAASADALGDETSDDPIAARLEREVSQVTAELVNARQELASEIEAELDRVRNDRRMKIERRLQQIDELKKQQSRFLKEGELPESRRLYADVRAYVQSVNAARIKAEKEYRGAAEAYGRRGELDKARQTLDELRVFLKRSLSFQDFLYAGDFYLGTAVAHFGKKFPFAIKITKSSGTRFFATAYIGDELPKYRPYPVEGQLVDGKVTAVVRSATEKDKLNQTLKGEFKSGELHLTYRGRAQRGAPVHGQLIMKPEPEDKSITEQ